MLYVVASMEREVTGLQQELEALGGSRGIGFPVECHLVGVGPRRAGKNMARVLEMGKRRPKGVLMLGVAGAVDPGTETGEIVLADRYVVDSAVVDSAMEPAPPIGPDPQMLGVAEGAHAKLRMPVRRGDSLTVDHLIAEGWERQGLREKFGVGSVNMEDHAVAAACGAVGVPFLSVRVILDRAEQTLPGYLPGLSRKRNAVLTQVMMRPWRIPTLLKLNSQMDLCQSVLTRFGMTYLEMEAARRRSAREQLASEAIY